MQNLRVKREIDFCSMLTTAYGIFRARQWPENYAHVISELGRTGSLRAQPGGQTTVTKVTKTGGKSADKPGSVADSHSSWRMVTHTLQQPTRGQREPRCRHLRGLAPDGVYPAARVAANAVRSYRTFSPLPVTLRRRSRSSRNETSAVYFLWHFPSPRGARPLAGILLCGARTFLCAL